MNPAPLLERDINRGIADLLRLDGWHVFGMEPISRKEWGKGTGELGQPDLLAIRYLYPAESRDRAEVLWLEGKRPRGRLAAHQRAWHEAERGRGALTWIAGQDFPASVDGFWAHYERSGLRRKAIRL